MKQFLKPQWSSAAISRLLHLADPLEDIFCLFQGVQREKRNWEYLETTAETLVKELETTEMRRPSGSSS